MNGRLDKVEMVAKVTKIKNGVDSKAWYPEWDKRQRGAASRIPVSYTHLTLPTKA